MGRWSVGVLMTGVLVLGITASVLAIGEALDATARQDARRADLVATALSGNLQQAVGALRGIDALATDGAVSADEFELFARDVLPGSLFPALAYSEIVPDADRAAWEARSGRPVREQVAPGQLVIAAQRPSYDVVTWVYPLNDVTGQVLGFDVFSDPARRRGAEAALASGVPAAAGPIAVAASGDTGLFLTNAVHDKGGRPIGFVSSGVAIDAVLARVQGQVDPATVTVRIGDRVLIGDPDRGGATRSFDAGERFTVTVGGGERPRLTVPIVVVAATALLAVAAVAARLADDRHRARRSGLLARQARLAELGRRLAATSSVDGVIEATLAGAASAVGAAAVELGHLDLTDHQRLLVHRVRADHTGTEVADHALHERLPLADTVRTGTAVTVEDVEALRLRYPALAPGVGSSAPRALRSVPIAASDGTVWAAICFLWFADDARDPDDEQATAAATTAAVVGGALERAVSAEALQGRAAQLSELAQGIAIAQDLAAVTAVVERWLPRVVAAERATLVAGGERSGAGAGARAATSTVRAPAAVSAPTAVSASAAVSASTAVIPLEVDGAAADPWTLEVRWAAEPAGTIADRMLLGTVANLVESAIGRVQRSHHEHQLIEQLQHALLAAAPQRPGLEVAVRYEPAISAVGIGGDWYDVVALSDDETGLVIGDVTGHGTAAVVVMAELQALTRHLLAAGTSLTDICSQLDRSLQRHGTYATAIVGRLDVATGELRFVNAGHPPPLLRRTGTITELHGGRRPLLGVGAPHDRVDPTSVSLRDGDLLLLYTDGLIERRDEPMQHSVAALADRLTDADTTPGALAAAFNGRHHGSDTGDDDAAALAIRFSDRR